MHRRLFLDASSRNHPEHARYKRQSLASPVSFSSLSPIRHKGNASLSFTFSVLLVFVAVRAAPQGQPSGAPTCTYSCSQVDDAGFGVGTYSDDGTTLFCSYRAFAGENPDDFYCKYSDVSLLQCIYMFGPTYAKSNLTVYWPALGRQRRWLLSPDSNLLLS